MTCEKCGYALANVVQVAIMVAGRVNFSKRLCTGCLNRLLDEARRRA